MILINDDCYKTIENIPEKSIDVCITDPPYNFGSKGGGFYANNKSTQRTYCDSLMKLDCCDFKPKEFLNLIRPKMKRFYGFFFCNKTLVAEYLNYAIKNKLQYDILVMYKTNPIPSCNNHHVSDLEYIIMIREPGTYFAKHESGTPLDDYSKLYTTSCKKGVHPAQKPIELIERFIKISLPSNEQRATYTILDPFMGSGTTGVAAALHGYNFIGIEKDEKYFMIAENRIKEVSEIEIEKKLPENSINKTQLELF